MCTSNLCFVANAFPQISQENGVMWVRLCLVNFCFVVKVFKQMSHGNPPC